MTIYKTTLLSGMLALLSPLCSCDSGEPDIGEKGDTRVQLVLNIITNNPDYGPPAVAGDSPTRADYSFEDPINQWECVNTLRVIIVRKDVDGIAGNDIVEHNVPINIPEGTAPETPVHNYRFPVEGGETKGIWLIANEDCLPLSDRNSIANMTAGQQFTESDLRDITLSTRPDRVLYDNNSNANKTYLPLSEQFEVQIKEPDEEQKTTEQEATFFVTRAAVKYSFTIDPESFVDTNAQKDIGYRISSITVSGLADREYLFPDNTVYDPAKYTPLTGDRNGRIITSFTPPSGITAGSHTFSPIDFGINGETATRRTETYAPEIYFAESPCPAGGYTVTVNVLKDGDTEPIQFGPVPLPNLPLLPRNTHVKVKFNFSAYGLSCEVKVIPYLGVPLNPDFGFDDIIVKPPKPRKP